MSFSLHCFGSARVKLEQFPAQRDCPCYMGSYGVEYTILALILYLSGLNMMASVFHTAVTVIEVLNLIQHLTENRLRHASGPVLFTNIESVTRTFALQQLLLLFRGGRGLCKNVGQFYLKLLRGVYNRTLSIYTRKEKTIVFL